MAWCRPGGKPLSEPMVARLPTQLYVIRPQWVKSLDAKSWSWTDPHCDMRLHSCLVAGDLLSTHGVAVTIASWAVRGAASFQDVTWLLIKMTNTMRCRYNMVKFLQNPYNRHSIFFLSTNSDLYSIPATLFMFPISCYIGPGYGGTRLIFYW